MGCRNIFRQIEDVYIDVTNAEKALDTRDEAQVIFIGQKKAMLCEVIEYVNSYKWLKVDLLKNKVQFYLKNKCNLDLLAEAYDISYKAAKETISYANKRLCERIGKGTIQLIKDNRLLEAKTTFDFQTGTLKLKDFIAEPAFELLPKRGAYMTVSLLDCENELKYYQTNAKAMLQLRREAVADDKLSYIRYILENDNPKFAEERLLLLRLLNAEISVEVLLKKIKKKEQIYN